MTSNDPFGDALRAMASLAGNLPGLGTGTLNGIKPTGGPLDAVLMQAQLAASGSLLRASQRGAQAWVDYARAAAAATDSAAKVDAVRAHLRALGQIAADEARQVQAQLIALDDQACAAATSASSDTPEPVRRAQAKT